MKKKILLIAGLILIMIGVWIGGIVIKPYLEEKNAGKNYDQLKEEVVIQTKENETEPETVDETVHEPVAVPIDFATLMAKYPNVYAWIRIPGTEIDYPIVRHASDNAYFLSHGIDGSDRIEGAIYTENYNSMDFMDPNTVIYGHNMLNGSMFAGLHQFEDRAFFEANREILIYRPDEILHYTIFAAYATDDLHILLNNDFSTKVGIQNYLNQIWNKKDMSNNIDTSMDVTPDDRILTLSTCGSSDDQRYVVQAVLNSIEN